MITKQDIEHILIGDMDWFGPPESRDAVFEEIKTGIHLLHFVEEKRKSMTSYHEQNPCVLTLEGHVILGALNELMHNAKKEALS